MFHSKRAISTAVYLSTIVRRRGGRGSREGAQGVWGRPAAMCMRVGGGTHLGPASPPPQVLTLVAALYFHSILLCMLLIAVQARGRQRGRRGRTPRTFKRAPQRSHADGAAPCPRCLVQTCALCWYCLSYIPYGQAMLMRMLGLPQGDEV